MKSKICLFVRICILASCLTFFMGGGGIFLNAQNNYTPAGSVLRYSKATWTDSGQPLTGVVVEGWKLVNGTPTPPEQEMDLVIPSSIQYNGEDLPVIGIASSRFQGTENSKIKTLTINDNSYHCFQISGNAFKQCTSLETVTIKSGIKTLILGNGTYGHVFSQCSSLKEFILPQDDDFSLIINQRYTFESTALEQINFPGTVTFTYTDDNDVCTFQKCTSLTSVKFAKATNILNKMFYQCTALREFSMGESDNATYSSLKIGKMAFWECSSLTSINLSVKSDILNIEKEAFNSSSIQSITVENAPVYVGDDAFIHAKQLKTVNFKDGITHIGVRAFADTPLLTESEEGSGVLIFPVLKNQNANDRTTWLDNFIIGENAFTNSGVQNIKFQTLAKTYSIGNYAFQRHGYLWGSSNLSKLNDVEFPKTSDIEIGEAAFNSSSLQNISMGGVKRLDKSAFRKCKELVSFIADKEGGEEEPATLTLYPETFSQCEKLKNFTLNNPIEKIEEKTFVGCKSLETITLKGKGSNEELEIGTQAFKDCIALKEITFTDAKVRIGDYAFEKNASLTEITIPQGISSLGEAAFKDCSSLTKFDVNNSTYPKIGKSCFQNCSSLNQIIVSPNVTDIKDYAFRGCSSLTSLPEFPSSLKSLGEGCFANCTGLEHGIIIPEGVENIGNGAFYHCSNMIDITLPSTLSDLDFDAITDCSNLESITLLNDRPCTLSQPTDENPQLFLHCGKLEKVYVPCTAKSLYPSAEVWKDYSNVLNKLNNIENEENSISIIDKDIITDVAGCDCFAENVTITPNGSLAFVNYDATLLNGKLSAHNFTLNKYLNINKSWNLTGILQNNGTYDVLNTIHGNNIATNLYDVAAIAMEDNEWSDYKIKDDALPTDNSSVFVWVFNADKNENTLSGDDYAVLPMAITTFNETTQSFDVSQQNNGSEKTTSGETMGYWYSLFNPYIGRISVKEFMNDNSDKIQGNCIYVYDETENKWHYIDGTDAENDAVLYPATGFMVAGNETNNEGKTLSVSFKPSQIVNDNRNAVSYKSTTKNNQVEFLVKANNTQSKMTARLNTAASDGFDGNDAYILLSDNNENLVEPYFNVDNHRIYSNNFSTLPYICPVNFHSNKDTQITLSAINTPNDMNVSLIDLINNTETLLEEEITLDVTAGENSDKYALKFTGKDSEYSLNGEDIDNIIISADNNRITVSGNELKRVEIYNALGQIIKTEQISGDNYSFILNSESGIYIIRAYSKTASKSHKAVIN